MHLEPKQVKALGVAIANADDSMGALVALIIKLLGKRKPNWESDTMKEIRRSALDAAITAKGYEGPRSTKEGGREFNTIATNVRRTLQRAFAKAYPNTATAKKKKSAAGTITAKGWSTATTAKRLGFIKSLLSSMLKDEKVVPTEDQHKHIVAVLAAANK